MPRRQNSSTRAFRNVVFAVVALSVIAIIAVRVSDSKNSASTPAISALAQCLTDKGVKMYGAEWCGHCKEQKKAFGKKAFSLIDYVECAVPGNPREQTLDCQKANIESYPTWEFSLGHRKTGELSFEVLANNSGCPWGELTDTNPEEITLPTITLDSFESDGSGPIEVEVEPVTE